MLRILGFQVICDGGYRGIDQDVIKISKPWTDPNGQAIEIQFKVFLALRDCMISVTDLFVWYLEA